MAREWAAVTWLHFRSATSWCSLNQDMPTTSSLAGTVQGSKVQRQERLKSRFRDRGGCVRLPRFLACSWIHQHKTASSCPQRRTYSSTSCLLVVLMESPLSRSALHENRPLHPNPVHRHPDRRHHALAPKNAPHANRRGREMKIIHVLLRSGVTHRRLQSYKRATRGLVRCYV